MKKVINNGKKFTMLGYEIEQGVSYMPADFFTMLDQSKGDLNNWKKLIANGVIEVSA